MSHKIVSFSKEKSIWNTWRIGKYKFPLFSINSAVIEFIKVFFQSMKEKSGAFPPPCGFGHRSNPFYPFLLFILLLLL